MSTCEAIHNYNTKMNECRLCGNVKDDLESIIEQDCFIGNVHRFLQIQICVYDNLPHHVCNSCICEVDRIVRFVTTCQEVQVEFHKKSFLEKNKILEKDIKLEDNPLDIDTLEGPAFEENKDIILFYWNIPELPLAGDGKPNSSIAIKTNRDQMSLLSMIGKDKLRQLGKEIYEKYKNRILENNHLLLTYFEIQDNVDRFQESLRQMNDPFLKQENLIEEDEFPKFRVKEPVVFLTPVQKPIVLPTNQDQPPVGPPTFSEVSNGSGTKNLVCSQCSFITNRRFRLNQHFTEVHEKRFSCDPCGRRFGKKSKLLLHIQTDHTDLSPMTCSLCAMSFTQRYNYKQHLKTHSSEGRLWFCDHCDKNFSHQHKLDVHVSKFHRSKSVKCSQCSYVASHKYQMKQHTREVHMKSIICEYCGKRESKKCRIVAHIQKKHMPKTEFVCEVCTARYSSKAWFEKHQRDGCP